MEELKFSKRTESKILNSPDYQNIFSGFFSFATQNTAVYADFSLVHTGNEIMKINTRCDKIFANKNTIAILNGKNIDVYEDKKWKKTLSIQNPDNLMDFPKDFDNIYNTTEENTCIFVVNDKLMKVTAKTILFNEKTFKNEIHEDDCTYFVAWKDEIIVLANSKSCNFMYFYKEELIEPEAYSPLYLRTDNETFDSIPVKNIKFWEDELLLIDNDTITVFTVNKISPTAKSEVKVIEYEIKNQEIIQLQKDVETDKTPKQHSIPEKTSSKFEPPVSILGEKLLEPEKQLLTGFEGMLPKPIALLETPAPVSTSANEDKKKMEPFKTFSEIFNSLDSKKAPQPPKATDEAQNAAVDKIDKEFVSKIASLKEKVSILDKREFELKALALIPSKFDLDGLYNLIFHNNIEEYENVLSSMIVQIENLQSVSENQINECIKFFDSKIFEKKSYKKPVCYKDPLCAKMSSVLNVQNPFEDILRGIKLLEMDFQGQKMKFKESGFEENPKLKNNTVQMNNEGADELQQQEKTQFNTSVVKESVSFESSIPSNDRIKENESATVPSQTPKTQNSPNSFLFDTIKQPQAFTQAPNAPNNQQRTLFDNNIQNLNTNLFVNDTSSLFNSFSANKLNIQDSNSQTPQNNNPSTDTNLSTGPVSAFNRLAGSRRLFQ